MKRATLCYISRKNASGREYLMLYRNKKQNDPNAGKWIGVGGKFEADETPDECMLREVREETGMELASFHFCGVIHFVSDTWEDEDMYLYRAEVEGTCTADEAATIKMPACEEGELQWIPEDQLMDLPMWEGDRLFLKPLIEGADAIAMTLRYEGDSLIASELNEPSDLT